jgi:ABC-type uncharacterized transport system permease subunit
VSFPFPVLLSAALCLRRRLRINIGRAAVVTGGVSVFLLLTREGIRDFSLLDPIFRLVLRLEDLFNPAVLLGGRLMSFSGIGSSPRHFLLANHSEPEEWSGRILLHCILSTVHGLGRVLF